MNKNLIWILVFVLLVTPIYAISSENYQMVLTTPDSGGKDTNSEVYYHNSAVGTTTGSTDSTNYITSLGIWFGGALVSDIIPEGWKIAIIANLTIVAFGLFFVSKRFDEKEHPLFKLFLFFSGIFLSLVGLSVTTQIAIASADSGANTLANIGTAYWVFIMLIIVSLMYWMIYFLKSGLNLYKFKKRKEVEG